jgi:hypothetical protein
MAERITIFRETTADFSTVEAFYASGGYFQAIPADCIVISAKAEDKTVGAVRLSQEGGVLVLRGMRIAQSYQRQGRIRRAMPPCISGSAVRSSKKSAMRWARADSWARVVGERSFSGRAISRLHTAIPSHMLRAANSSRRYGQSDACDAL